MGEVFLDAFIDSLKVLAVLVVVNFLIALIEPKIAGKIKEKDPVNVMTKVTMIALPSFELADQIIIASVKTA